MGWLEDAIKSGFVSVSVCDEHGEIDEEKSEKAASELIKASDENL